MTEVAGDNLRQNYLVWNKQHDWSEDGDEWKGQAHACGLPYDVWKGSLAAALILPNTGSERNILEIGPGHGRWSAYLIPNSQFCTLVDLSPNCLDYCRTRFGASENVEYFLTTGASLPRYCAAAIDFVWSFDAFVHMAAEVINQYLAEIARVLRPTGIAILHHSNIEDLNSHQQGMHIGWRSAVNNDLVRSVAEHAGLTVERQFVYWDEMKKIGVPNFGDSITVLRQARPDRTRRRWRLAG